MLISRERVVSDVGSSLEGVAEVEDADALESTRYSGSVTYLSKRDKEGGRT